MDLHPYDTIDDLARTIPVFPLSGALLLPRGRLPLNIFEPRYLSMVDDALAHHRLIGMVQPRQPDDRASRPEVYDLGCVGRLTGFNEVPDGRYMITLTGVCRFRIENELETVTPYRQMAVDYDAFARDLDASSDEPVIDRDELVGNLKAYLETFDLQADWDSIAQAPLETLINSLSMICPFEAGEKQALLEAPTVKGRAEALVALLKIATAKGDTDEDMPVQ
ncbi:MAG: LON peptidase substrate-binding domain-containing protein [Alphaproteobacteria bacterium]